MDVRTAKLYVPCASVTPTQGSRRRSVQALCQLYLEGGCRQGMQCHQVHASPDVVRELRVDAMERAPCCMKHTPEECASFARDTLRFVAPVADAMDVDADGARIPLLNFSPTKGLAKLTSRSLTSTQGAGGRAVLRTHASAICTNHRATASGSGLCCFGEECSFLHLCRCLSLRAVAGRAQQACAAVGCREVDESFSSAHSQEHSLMLPSFSTSAGDDYASSAASLTASHAHVHHVGLNNASLLPSAPSDAPAAANSASITGGLPSVADGDRNDSGIARCNAWIATVASPQPPILPTFDEKPRPHSAAAACITLGVDGDGAPHTELRDDPGASPLGTQAQGSVTWKSHFPYNVQGRRRSRGGAM
jgi:hypothetical protein